MGRQMTNRRNNSAMDDRDLYSGLIRLHVLHHAAKGPLFGLGMIEELSRHGYRISPGTLYPLLQGLEKKGYLGLVQHRDGKSLRKIYHATPAGRKALSLAKGKIRELFRELIEGNRRSLRRPYFPRSLSVTPATAVIE
jgi:DNA-binding PadR family transcriptional regulator